jgi:hypothetical protein
MKEINKDIVKKHQIGCWDYVKQLAAYKCMIELLSSLDVSIPVTVLDR